MMRSQQCLQHHHHQRQPHAAAGTARPLPPGHTRPQPQLLRGLLAARAVTRLEAAAAAKAAVELSPKEQLLLTQALNYEHTVELPEGQLVVAPLKVEWLQRTGDLLADAFVDAKGIQPYRRYVRRNIGKYLDQHIALPPSAVLLTAILRTPVALADSDPDLNPLDSYCSSSSDGSQEGVGASSSSSGSGQAEQQPGQQHWSQRWTSWLVKPGEPAAAAQPDAASSSTTSSSEASTSQQQQLQPPQQQDAREPASSSGSSSSSVGTLMQSALQRLSRLGQQPERPVQMREQLLGVVEVSFRESTRSTSITLNPPQKCAYLCNMAVASNWRRRGVARALLTGVEDLCMLAGEAELYLHLRFKDTPTAGSLYQAAGFASAKRDCVLVLLLGQEPRHLMKKQLDTARQLTGRVKLPQLQQAAALAAAGEGGGGGAGIAEPEQQQQPVAADRGAPPRPEDAASPAAPAAAA